MTMNTNTTTTTATTATMTTTTTTINATSTTSSILGSRKLSFNVSFGSDEILLYNPNSKYVPLSEIEQAKCDKRQNAEIKVNLFQNLYDDTTDQQREQIRNGSINCFKFLRVFFLISESSDEFRRMLAGNNGDIATVGRGKQQNVFSSRKKIAFLTIALILLTGLILMFLNSRSIGVSAAIASVASQRFYEMMMRKSNFTYFLWTNNTTSARPNNRRIPKVGSWVDFDQQELYTMDLTTTNSSTRSTSTAVLSASNDQQDGPWMMEDSCSYFDVQNKTCIVSISGNQKVELSHVVEGGKQLALLHHPQVRASTGDMAAFDRTCNEIFAPYAFSPGKHYSNALVKHPILYALDTTEVKNIVFDATVAGGAVAIDRTHDETCESKEVAGYQSWEPKDVNVMESDTNDYVEGWRKEEEVTEGTESASSVEPKDPEKDESIGILILDVSAQWRLSVILYCFCCFTVCAIFLFCCSAMSPRGANSEGEDVLVDDSVNLASMERLEVASNGEQEGAVDGVVGEPTPFAVGLEPVLSAATGESASSGVVAELICPQVTREPMLATVAREQAPSTVVLESTLYQARGPMVQEHVSPASTGEPMTTTVIEEHALPTVAREATEVTFPMETSAEPISSTVSEESAPHGDNSSQQLGTIFVNGLRRSARLRGKRAVKYRC